MKVITKRDRIKDVLRRYREQYPDPERRIAGGKRVGDSIERLEALDLETCSEDDVTKAIGNGTWTMIHCKECFEPQELGIMIQRNEETGPIILCKNCVEMAMQFLNRAGAENAV